MLTFVFLLLMVVIYGKLFRIALRAAWGVTKILFGLILLPLFMIYLVFSGLLFAAFGILIFVGLITLSATVL